MPLLSPLQLFATLTLATLVTLAPPSSTDPSATPGTPPSPAPTGAALQLKPDVILTTRDPADSPIEVRQITRTTPDGPLRIYAAVITLRDPRVQLITSGPAPTPAAPDTLHAEAILEPTDTWAKRAGVTLAINAHFFGYPDQSRGPWVAGKGVDLKGPCITDGLVVSPSEPHATPTFAFFKDRTARVGMLTADDLLNADDAVSGICNPKRVPPAAAPASETPNALLVRDGINTGLDAHPAPKVRHPRTALGLSADGSTLILAVIDGRQPDLSIGMTLVELADLLIELGAHNALNLDGGGSSAFYFDPDGPGPRTDLITNSPSDAAKEQSWRPVGASLGIRIDSNAPSPNPSPHCCPDLPTLHPVPDSITPSAPSSTP